MVTLLQQWHAEFMTATKTGEGLEVLKVCRSSPSWVAWLGNGHLWLAFQGLHSHHSGESTASKNSCGNPKQLLGIELELSGTSGTITFLTMRYPRPNMQAAL